MMKKLPLFLLIPALLCFAAPAVAGFYVDKSGVAATAPVDPSVSVTETGKARIVHVGTMPADIPSSKGMGEDMPLPLAVQQIMPDGWHVYLDDDHAKELPVSWTGADIWLKSLERLMERIDGTAKVDWTRKVVTVKVPLIKEDALPAEKAGGTAAVAAATKVQIWRVRYTDGDIQAALRRWAEESGEGWQISWESPMEFPTVLEAEFSGSFQDAVDGVINALAGSEAPVWVRYYDNRVVRIIPAGTKTE